MIYCLQETHFSHKDTQTERQEMEKDISRKWQPKKVGVAILISDNVDCNLKMVRTDQEGNDKVVNT